MCRELDNYTYFIERLTVGNWVLTIFPFFIRRLKQKKIVYYIDCSQLGIVIAAGMAKLIRIKIKRFSFRMVEMKDNKGNLLSFKILFNDLGDLQDDIFKRPVFKKIMESKEVNSYIKVFLRKQALFDTKEGADQPWDSGSFKALILVRYALREENNKAKGGKVVFFMDKRLWSDEISKYAASYNVEIIWMPKPIIEIRRPLKIVILSLFKRRYILWFKTLKNYIINEVILKPFQYLTFRNRNVSYELPIRSLQNMFPRLAVDYYGQFNLNKPELFSDLFFWHQSLLSGEDISIVFNIKQYPLDMEKVKWLNHYNMEALVLNPKVLGDTLLPVFYHWPRIFRKKRLFDISDYPEKKWVNQQMEHYQTDYEYWKEFFSKNNIKIYITWFKYDASHCVIADALQSQGGVTTMYQRSFEEFSAPSRSVACDVFFGFSHKNAEIEEKAKSIIAYYIEVGYPGDYRFPLLHKQAQEIRRRLQRRGAKRIISFFDENSSNRDPRWLPDLKFLRVNYSFLLEKVLSESEMGLVIKPKTPFILKQCLESMNELFNRAKQTGRLFIFGIEGKENSYPPVAAALASDIAVHGHLCAATAGVESALAGVPTLLLDREGWPGSSLYGLGEGKVVFTNWEDLWKACKEHWAVSGGVPGFGDWSLMINEIDSFRDGMAAERIGTYLKWLLDGFKERLNRERVMADAAQRYVDIWGKDKIKRINTTVPLQFDPLNRIVVGA